MAQQIRARTILYNLLAAFPTLSTAAHNRILVRSFRGEEAVIIFDHAKMLFRIDSEPAMTTLYVNEREANEYFARTPITSIKTIGFAGKGGRVMLPKTAFAITNGRNEEPVPSILYAYGQRTGDDSIQAFLKARTRNVAPDAPTYTIDDFVDPMTLDEVSDRKNAYFIEENVNKNGKIHGLYDPESLYQWFVAQGRVNSPSTRRRVQRRFVRLPRYLAS